MISKKICLLGAFAVGKTSLVSRFVSSLFAEKYHTTVGVKIDKKMVQLEGQEIGLLIWDLAGEDEFQRVEAAYFLGASGYLLVVDGTRRATLDQALLLRQRVETAVGPVPFQLLLNKSDLASDWDLDEAVLEGLRQQQWPLLKTSAKTGAGVEEAFLSLTRAMLPK
jgi:small GTP-binding protein